MRRTIVAGNWKMNTELESAEKLVGGIRSWLDENHTEHIEVLVAPPFPFLTAVGHAIANSPIRLGAQNVHFERSGAFTGEVSAGMLRSIGCDVAIIGHSERREIFGETDLEINKKVLSALEEKLDIILCVGEKEKEREDGKTFEVVERQLTLGLKGVTDEQMASLVIAYEPVWAIGTGKTATPEIAEEVHAFLRTLLTKIYDEKVAEHTPILYGGSVKPNNAEELFAQSNIDGGLIGGASLSAEDFTAIVGAAIGSVT